MRDEQARLATFTLRQELLQPPAGVLIQLAEQVEATKRFVEGDLLAQVTALVTDANKAVDEARVTCTELLQVIEAELKDLTEWRQGIDTRLDDLETKLTTAHLVFG